MQVLFLGHNPWVIYPGNIFLALRSISQIWVRHRVQFIYIIKTFQSICHPCDIPYNYIVKLETFAEDYQFIMKKILGLWNEDFTAKHKQVGVTIGMFC